MGTLGSAATKTVSDKLTEFYVSQSINKAMRRDYLTAAAKNSNGSIRPDEGYVYKSLKERLPGVFQDMKFDISGKTTDRRVNTFRVSRDLTDRLAKEAETNNVLRTAILRAGAGYMQNGNLRTYTQFRKDQLDEIAGYVQYQLGLGLASSPRFRVDPNSTDENIQRKLANKSSRRVDQSYKAMSILAQAEGLNPYLGVERYIKPEGHRGDKDITRRNHVVVSAMTDRFQAPKYSLRELSGGVVIDPLAREYDANGKRNTTYAHGFIDVTESTATRLLGMRGHNTYGTGNDIPAVISLALDDIFATDKDGKPRYVDGKRMIDPVMRQYAVDAINNGIDRYGKHYVYAGKNANGDVMFAESGRYNDAVDKARRNGYGSPFTQWSNGRDRSDWVKEKKAIGYDSKVWSPGELMSNYGYKTPRTALVNMEAFYEWAGIPESDRLDGSNLIMPKYMGRATQVRRPLVKGVDVGFNFKKYLAEAGLLDTQGRFFMPTINATAEDIEAYKSGKLTESSPEFAEKFVDIMDKRIQGLTDASTLKGKNTLFGDKKMTYLEQEQYLYDLTKKYGTEVMRNSGDWNINKNFIPSQLSRNIMLTPEFMELRQALAEQFTAEMETVEGQIKHVFASDSEFDKKIRSGNYDLLNTPEARARIQETLAAFNQKMAEGAIYNPGNTTLALAAMAPGNIFNPYAEKVLGRKANEFGQAAYLTDEEIANKTLEDEDEISSGRTPGNTGEITVLKNVVSKNGNAKADAWDRLFKMGLDPDASYSSRGSIFKSGTADFDGDFMTLMTGMIIESVTLTNEKIGKAIDKEKENLQKSKNKMDKVNKDVEGKVEQYENIGENIVHAAEDRANATGTMSRVHAYESSLGNFNFDNPNELADAAKVSATNGDNYNDASTPLTESFAKVSRATKEAMKNVGLSAVPLLSKASQALENPEVMRRVAHSFEEKTMPSVYDVNGILSIMTANRQRQIGQGDFSVIEKLFEGVQQQLIGETTGPKADYLHKWYDTMSKLFTGKAAYISSDDAAELSQLLGRYQEYLIVNGTQTERDQLGKYIASYNTMVKRGLTENNILNTKNPMGQRLLDEGFHSTSWDTDLRNPVYAAQLQRREQIKEDMLDRDIEYVPETEKGEDGPAKNKKVTRFSISDISSFMKYPAKMINQMRGLVKEEDKTTETLFGSIMHEAMEDYSKARIKGLSQEESVEAGMARFEEALKDQRISNPGLINDSHNKLFDRGRSRLGEAMKFLEDKEILASEQAYALNWDLPKDAVQSYAATDLRYKDKDGNVVTLDFKSNGASNLLQPLLYAFLNDRPYLGTSDFLSRSGEKIKALTGGEGLNEDGSSRTTKTGFMSFNLKDENGGIDVNLQDYNFEKGQKAFDQFNDIAKLLYLVQNSVGFGDIPKLMQVIAAIGNINSKYKEHDDLLNPKLSSAVPEKKPEEPFDPF